jgi:hypothetical protein
LKSQTTKRFWNLLQRLPGQTQERARRAYEQFRANPGHPGLRFKRVDGEEPLYSVRIGSDHRALGLLKGDTITWFWIGTHDVYERVLEE